MTQQSYEYFEGVRVPIKAWTKGVAVDDKALEQLRNTSALPFIYKHLAVMPDVHWGMGATIGSVVATRGAIVPAAVGVDIGCGMVAARTNFRADQLPDNLHAIRSDIEANVPHGRTENGVVGKDVGGWSPEKIPAHVLHRWVSLRRRYWDLVERHPGIQVNSAPSHLGTLGTGNHFVELCLDEKDQVWVMLHSGSRGVGNRIGSYFIGKAKEEMRRYHIGEFLPDQNLAYLVERTEVFDDYIEAIGWAQDYARANRECMLASTFKALSAHLPGIREGTTVVNCHHNYVERENHFGSNVLVTRKGAVRARTGDLGIIPGSMGTGSFIVRGKGNADSFCSCSHGAGRAMSRGEAKKRITLEEHATAMRGIEARLDAGVLDESPAAYKDISAVMGAQEDLVEVVHRLHQIVNIKG